MKKIVFLLLMLSLLCACALADDSLLPLTPVQMQPEEGFAPVALYCGPTQGFYRHEEQTIDLTQPFVCFGQYDCWVMVAQGNTEHFGPVGFIEGGLFSAPDLPVLAFEDSYAAMIEEDAAVTNDPLAPDGAWNAVLPRGTQVVVLAAYLDSLYVQTEIDGMPARVFVPASAL
ncbi:MAG: hypothetical protein IKU34_08140 [Clostridia bacterium]|nr:hypothetical protein [Clostridia bacterium]